ncbi:MAG: hypothetical protein KDD44_15310, partial [Bdellovibrionales bacterium]|nr:hypothetical protein [Bdellovibrionales bacterium]
SDAAPWFEVAVGHSGDIEPFIYLTLMMEVERWASDASAPPNSFLGTLGGASLLQVFEACGARGLNPLEGLSLEIESRDAQAGTLTFPGKHIPTSVVLPLSIFRAQRDWLFRNGIACQL